MSGRTAGLHKRGTRHDLTSMAEALTGAKPCPICGKPADARLRPFCSKRCADVDLNRWLKGVYAIPVSEQVKPEPEGSAEPE